MTLQQIYVQYLVTFRTDEDIMMFTNTKEDYENLKRLLSESLSKLYKIYLNSPEFDKDKQKIVNFESVKKKLDEKDCKRYIERYDSLAKELLNYYKAN